ncbi:MAG: glycosyltransferase family 4 protein [Acholeplasma sp.]|jgi:glycosyltransferase involved in cell wall biosynthesis|nr:glycosyltransferase family 4 protein [Acholeplasma sp.]
MKLLIISSETYPTYSGDGLSAFRFAGSLQEYCETSILSFSRDSSFKKTEDVDGVRIFRTSYFGTCYISKAISRLKLVNLAWKIGKHHNVWLIYGLLPGATLLVVLAKLLRRKTIFRPTLAGFDTINKQNLSKISLRIIYFCADGLFIRNSKMISENLKKNKIIFYSSQGVQLERFSINKKMRCKLRLKYRIPDTATIILMVGHLCNRKGFPEIAYWIKNLHSEPFLVHVGDNKEIKTLNEVRSILGKQFISFPPNHSIEEFYWMSDLFVLGSIAEGFPSNTILEAMASSLPILCRRIEGYEDYITDGYNAGLFSNEEEFRNGFEKIVSNKTYAIGIAENAFNDITTKHNIKTVASEFYSFIKSNFS